MTGDINQYMKDYRKKNKDKIIKQEKKRWKKKRVVREKMRQKDIIKIIEEHKDKLIGNLETKDFVISLVKHFLPYLKNCILIKLKHRSSMEMAAAILFLAYRKAKIPVVAKDISEIFGFEVEERRIWKSYKDIKKELGMHPCKMPSLLSKKCIILFKPEDFLLRFGKKLDVSDKTIEDAKQILRRSHEFVQSKNPTSLAASALYIASLFNFEKKTQREIADIAGTTEMTIRQISKGLIKQNKKNG